MKKYRFEIFRDEAEEYRFRFVSANGQVMATSESYTRKEKCRQTVEKMVTVLHDNWPYIIDTTLEK